MMVSVIIPSYNREATIMRSVESVLSQTYQDLEVIVVDDCSTDHTKEVLEQITDSRFRYYCLERNSGACTARNKGIELARGDYIAFQDSDDEFVTEKLEIQLKKLIENDADVCFCQKKRFSVDKSKSLITHHDLEEGFIPYIFLCQKPRVSTQTIFARRSVFDKYRFDPNVKKAQDFDWTLRAAEHYSFYFIKLPLVNQFLQDDSITIKGKNHKLECEMCEYFLQKYSEKCKSDPTFHAALLKRYARQKYNLAENASNIMKEIYMLEPNETNFVKYLLAKLHVLPILYRAHELIINRKM